MLSGLRVLELAHDRVALAGRILGDLGADVIRCEPPGGAPDRHRGPYLGDVEDVERALGFLAMNPSKRGITLDWRRDEGASILRQLVQASDVLLEGEAPGALAGLGLGSESLRAEHPGLVHCAVTPFGQTGPWADFRAGDLVVVAMGGNLAMTGDPDRPPVRCSMPTSLFHGGPEAVLGILMALHGRAETGEGDFVDCSLQECQLATLITGAGQAALGAPRPRRSGGRLGRTREIWRARDGWVSFGLRGGPSRIPNLIAAVTYMDECGLAPDWLLAYDWDTYDPNALSEEELDRLEAAFADFFRTRSMRELYEEALARRILLAPCNDAREIAAHPQLRDRGLFVELELPHLGARIEMPGAFARSGDGDIGVRARPPRLGEHNADVYGELGVPADEQERLRGEGVL